MWDNIHVYQMGCLEYLGDILPGSLLVLFTDRLTGIDLSSHRININYHVHTIISKTLRSIKMTKTRLVLFTDQTDRPKLV